MSFSYDISVRVSKQLTTVTSDLYKLGFCTSASSTVAPPLLQIAVAGSGTAAADAVKANCYTSDTVSSQTIASANPFGTAATATHMYIRENSGNPSADVEIQDDNNFTPLLKLKAGDTAFLRHANAGYSYLMMAAADTSSTASLQVVIVGE
jgi:hypothetical protein